MKYKVQLVVNGFVQKKGVNFDENFHGQARSSIQLTFGLAGSMDLEFEQLDSSLPSFLVT